MFGNSLNAKWNQDPLMQRFSLLYEMEPMMVSFNDLNFLFHKYSSCANHPHKKVRLIEHSYPFEGTFCKSSKNNYEMTKYYQHRIKLS